MSNVVFELFAKLGLDSSEYENGLGKAKSMAGTVGGAIGNGLKTAAKVGIGALTAATGAATAFGVASVKAGGDFDKSMSQVAATMGKSMEELQTAVGETDTAFGSFSGNLREYAQFMGANTAFSATQAADALNYMALAGYDAQKSMDMLPNVLNLAAAGNMDLAKASDMVTDTQTAFGISLKRTAKMVDEMAKASATGNTSVEQLGEAFLTVGGLAQEMHGGMIMLKDGTIQSVDGVQELEIALTAMANAGIKGSEAGTHMRNMLLKLASPTSDGTKALQALGVSVFDTEGNMRSLAGIMADLDGAMGNLTQEERLQAISDLFNTRDTAAAEALMNAIASDWNKIGESILNADGAAQKMADTQLDNLAGDITLFKSALEGAQIAISDKLTPTLRKFVQFGTEGLGDLTKMFGKFDGSKYADEMGRMTQEGMKAKQQFEKEQQEAQKHLMQMLTNGVGMVAGLVPTAIKAGAQILKAVGKGLIENAPLLFDTAVDLLEMIGTAMVNGADVLVKKGGELIKWLMDGISANTTPFLNGAMSLLTTLGQGLIAGAPTLAIFVTDLLMQLADFLIVNAPTMINGARELIAQLANGLAENLPLLLEKATDMIVSLAIALTDPASLTQMLLAAANLLMALANGLVSAIPKLLDAIPVIISNMVAFFITEMPVMLTTGAELLLTLIRGLIQTIPRLVAAIPAIITALVGGLVKGVKQIWDVGKQMVEGLWKGIKDNWDALVRDVMGLGENLINGVKGIFGIHSPSRVFADMGKFIDLGLAKGVTGNMGVVDKAFKDLQKYTSMSLDMGNFTASVTGKAENSKVLELLEKIADSNKDVTIVLEGDAQRLFRAIKREAKRDEELTGQPSFG